MRLKWNEVSPEGRNAMLALQKVVDKSKIDHKLLELIKIRASQINGCAYCLDMHTKDSLALGENEQRIFLLSAWKEAPFFSDQERAALAWCEALTDITAKGVSKELYQQIEKHFSPGEIVDLTLAIVAINGWNRLAIAFQSEVGKYVSNLKKKK